VQKSRANGRFLINPTNRKRGCECLLWVDSGGSIAALRTAGIGRIAGIAGRGCHGIDLGRSGLVWKRPASSAVDWAARLAALQRTEQRDDSGE
jgi:hypothetical protein